MEKRVVANEELYRLVKRSQPDTIDMNGRATSALFKQNDGVSVDRDGGRIEESIVNTFRSRFEKRFKGLVRVGAGVCIDNSMAVIPEPQSNEYHAEIYDDFDKTPVNNINALILADNAKVIVYENNVKWTKL